MWGFVAASDGRFYRPVICGSAMYAAGLIKRTDHDRERNKVRVQRYRAAKLAADCDTPDAQENKGKKLGNALRNAHVMALYENVMG